VWPIHIVPSILSITSPLARRLHSHNRKPPETAGPVIEIDQPPSAPLRRSLEGNDQGYEFVRSHFRENYRILAKCEN